MDHHPFAGSPCSPRALGRSKSPSSYETRPRRIVFVDGYPTTATGKIRRVELRAMAAEVLIDDTAARGVH